MSRRPRYWRRQYNEYMASSAWHEKRSLILRRADGRCERCETSTTRLEVHHRHYKNFGNEKLTDLLGVCRECHVVLDQEREAVNRITRLGAWMTAVHGKRWEKRYGWPQAEQMFSDWLKKR